MPEPTPARTYGPVDDLRELYALQRAITDSGGTLTRFVHQAIDALRQVWDAGLRSAQAAPAEHCIHDRGMHDRHHTTPVDGCPWCEGAGTPAAQVDRVQPTGEQL